MHEAGHVVMGWYLGLPLKKATVIHNTRHLGLTIYTHDRAEGPLKRVALPGIPRQLGREIPSLAIDLDELL
jgi:hypothetical protein